MNIITYYIAKIVKWEITSASNAGCRLFSFHNHLNYSSKPFSSVIFIIIIINMIKKLGTHYYEEPFLLSQTFF